jgi:cobalt-precorrin-7 (C5)-methyltransferase
MAKIHIVGAGPGSPDYVTPIARRIVREAQLVVGAERVLELFKEDLRGEKIPLTAKNIEETIKYAIRCAEEGRDVVLLSTGDPCFSGLLKAVINVVGGNIDFDIIPGISSIQACAARLKISWDEAAVASFHEGADENRKGELLDALRRGKTAIVLPDPKAFKPKEIAKFLIDKGLHGRTSVFMCENLTLEGERIIETTLEEVSKLDFGSLCVMVIKPSERK